MGEDLIENEIYVAKLFGSDLQGNDLYKLEPLKQIGNATFVKATPEFKRGDILKSTITPELTVIFDEKTSTTTFDSIYHNNMGSRHCWSLKRFRHATEKEKQEFFDELKTQGKRWNVEKKRIEDISKRKFKAGDKVRIKDGISSKTHKEVSPSFNSAMDRFIGKELTVQEYTNDGFVILFEDYIKFHFREDWLEPWSNEPKKGDLAIFWDNDYLNPLIRLYHAKSHRGNSHLDNHETVWDNAVKWDGTKEQFEKILNGEI